MGDDIYLSMCAVASLKGMFKIQLSLAQVKAAQAETKNFMLLIFKGRINFEVKIYSDKDNIKVKLL